jgi:hypothetical protein
MIQYKFNENKVVEDLKKYIDFTYDQHYAQAKTQTTEIVFENGHGEGFCIGNIIKYAQRFGKKNGKNTEDLFKVIHYAIILIGKLEKDDYEYDDQMLIDKS